MFRYILILIILIISGLIGYMGFLISPTSLSDEKIRFVVGVEESQDSVLERLHTEGFIRSKNAFLFVTSLRHFTAQIEPGTYLLSKKGGTIGVSNTLFSTPYQRWVIIAPGMRKEQIGLSIKKRFGWTDEKYDEFIKTAKEGYLLPETYLVSTGYSGKETAEYFMNQFKQKLDEGLYNKLLKKNIRVETAVKMASLIERESGGDDDKALIAGIMWNRLDKNMKLQIDATVQYALGTPDDWWPILTGKNLSEVDSPYNTYLYKGLPQGPICNPSLASLNAVSDWQDTDCLFYLHDHNRQIHCAVTYEEHLENIEKYLK